MSAFILMSVMLDPKAGRVHAWVEELSKQDQAKRFPKPSDGSPFFRLLQGGMTTDVVLPLDALTMFAADQACVVALLSGQDNAKARARTLLRVFETKIVPHFLKQTQSEIDLLAYRIGCINTALHNGRTHIRQLG